MNYLHPQRGRGADHRLESDDSSRGGRAARDSAAMAVPDSSADGLILNLITAIDRAAQACDLAQSLEVEEAIRTAQNRLRRALLIAGGINPDPRHPRRLLLIRRGRDA